uniref:WD_REPEATS_REGION domain-containing protein n=1 Tax=Macrostomum lignano TaxID=282301 RepID=A0A1I8HRA0_9PLAT
YFQASIAQLHSLQQLGTFQPHVLGIVHRSRQFLDLALSAKRRFDTSKVTCNVTDLAFESVEGRYLLTGHADGAISIYDTCASPGASGQPGQVPATLHQPRRTSPASSAPAGTRWTRGPSSPLAWIGRSKFGTPIGLRLSIKCHSPSLSTTFTCPTAPRFTIWCLWRLATVKCS